MREIAVDSNALDANAVLREYRWLLGFDADLTERLHEEPLTVVTALAALSDFALTVFLLYMFGLATEAVFGRFDIQFWEAALVMAVSPALGFFVANSGDDYRKSPERKISFPVGISTGLIVRSRMKRRRAAREKGVLDATDPLILGPVFRSWAAPLLERAEELLRPDLLGTAEDSGFNRLAAISPDPQIYLQMGDRIALARAALQKSVLEARAQTSDPGKVVGEPLTILGETFTSLRRSITAYEQVKEESEGLRLSLRRTFAG